jgi:hypothetical protein
MAFQNCRSWFASFSLILHYQAQNNAIARWSKDEYVVPQWAVSRGVTVGFGE